MMPKRAANAGQEPTDLSQNSRHGGESGRLVEHLGTYTEQRKGMAFLLVQFSWNNMGRKRVKLFVAA